MVNVGVGAMLPFVGIEIEITQHVFMDVFLEIYADGAIAANDLIGADAGAFGHITAGIRNPDIVRNVPDRMVRSLDGGPD